jgi:hypothetical protein
MWAIPMPARFFCISEISSGIKYPKSVVRATRRRLLHGAYAACACDGDYDGGNHGYDGRFCTLGDDNRDGDDSDYDENYYDYAASVGD